MIFPVSKSVSVNVTAPVSTALESAIEELTTHPFSTFVVTFSGSPLTDVPPATVKVAAVLSLPILLPF
ncbi:Uncharacterised protein [Streptococcus vestibularis]|uniref:Uncharacterized protein n=1 Tax=Streptococcus vestibularis TaxID=1343 RepID=A0A564SCJ1_STRVE|nr:Uncharacterised protein [Streptococcus vestibularis]